MSGKPLRRPIRHLLSSSEGLNNMEKRRRRSMSLHRLYNYEGPSHSLFVIENEHGACFVMSFT